MELNVARNVVLVTLIECRVGSLRRVPLIRGALITPIGKAINVFFSRRLLTVLARSQITNTIAPNEVPEKRYVLTERAGRIQYINDRRRD